MKFGLLKSKIEKYIIESYLNDDFKNTLFVFDELILKNKNVSKLFYLYDELSGKKSMNESVANDYINESIIIYENTINKISKKQLDEIKMWVGHVKTENQYNEIDNLFSSNILTLENKIQSRKIILENLKKSSQKEDLIENVSLNTLVEAANKTLNNFLSELNESSKKTLLKVLSEDESKLKGKYEILKETVVEKLEDLKLEEKESDVIKRIDETIQKVSIEEYNKISYFKLFELNKSI
jgi:hypothetical protein